ncbi:hypothetical protein LPJ61_006020, partial [Coemansia biformis]
YFDGIAGQVRFQYRALRRCATPLALDRAWGDILVSRQALQEHCEEFILAQPAAANAAVADRHLWRVVFYDAIAECRKRLRLRLHPPLLNLSRAGSIASSSRSSDGAGSNEGSSAAEGRLEAWQREWWTRTLVSLFNEALGYLQDLLRQVMESLGPISLTYVLRHANDPLHHLPPGFLVARRLYVYIGDLYRYQCMYLPLLSLGGTVRADTSALLDLARWSYARARAMHMNSSRACTSLALLAAYTHDRFEAVFWQLCGLCYADQPAGRRLLLHAWPLDDETCEDHIEASVIGLAQAILGGSDCATPADAFLDALAALEDDLAETRARSMPLNLADDFWAREYQLSVVLAALLTVVTHSLPASDAVRSEHQGRIQRLAVTLLLRQMLCLSQMLDTAKQLGAGRQPDVGHPHVRSAIYPLASAALWVDMWRSSDSLAGACADERLPDLVPRAAELFGFLVQLVREHSDIELTRTARRRPEAHTALPHDVALVGWASLRPVQQELRYEDVSDSSVGPDAGSSASLLGLWQDPHTTTQVVMARIQALLLAEAAVLPFLSWDASGELVVEETPSPKPGPGPRAGPVAAPRVEPLATPKARPATSTLVDDAPTPLCIPDEDTWRHHLPVLQKWVVAGTYK